MNIIIGYAIAACFLATGTAPAAPCSLDSVRADLRLPSVPPFAKEGRVVEGSSFVWGENAGWLDLRARHGGLRIGSNVLAGWIWLENCGWVCVGKGMPLKGKRYSNESANDWGVNNDDRGNLSGFAWSEVAGWINFNAAHSRIYLDENGRFHGYAWGENVGWIRFGSGGRDKYLAKATPGPWREIGAEEDGRFAGGCGNGETYVQGGHVSVCGLNYGSERYNGYAGILCSGMVDVAGLDGYVRHDEKPVCIDYGEGCLYVRGPPGERAI